MPLSRVYLRRRFYPMCHDRTLHGVKKIRMIMCRVGLHLGNLHFCLATLVYLFVVTVDGLFQRHFSLLNGYAGVDEALTVLERMVPALATI